MPQSPHRSRRDALPTGRRGKVHARLSNPQPQADEGSPARRNASYVVRRRGPRRGRPEPRRRGVSMRPSGGIVMVAYTDYPWDPRVRREAESLVNRGHAVTVVCCREAGQVPRETVAGVTVDRVPLSMRRGGPTRYLYQYLVFLIMAALRIRRLRPAAVHLHSVPDFVVFAATGPRLRGVPVTLDLHEAMPEMVLARFPRSRAIVRLALAAERLSCRFANRVIVVNETIRDLIGGRSVPADRITVLYNSPVVSAGETLIPSEPTAGMLHLVYAGS